MCLKMLTRVFMASDESNLISFKQRNSKKVEAFFMGMFVNREVMSKLFIISFSIFMS